MARIAMIVGNPCNPDNRVIKEAEALAANGHTVQVFCTARARVPSEETRNGVSYARYGRVYEEAAGPHKISYRLQQRSLTEARRTVDLAASMLWPVRHALASYQLIQKFQTFTRDFAAPVAAFRPDIVHAHDLNCLSAGAAAAKRAGARLVYDSHELETHRNPPLPPLVRMVAGAIEQRLIRRAHAVITVSEPIANHLRDEYAIKRPTVILNAPNFEDAAQSDRCIRADAGVTDGAVLGVYVGLVTINRGVETLIDALARLPHVTIAAVGPVNAKMIGGVLARAERAGVAERFKLLPPVPPEKVVSYIADADFGLNPLIPITLSYQYAMPNKLFEMALAGLPIVNSDAAESARFVRENQLGVIFRHSDPEACARAISEVSGDLKRYRPSPDRLAELRAKFSWQRQADELRRLYGGLLARPSAQATASDSLAASPI